MSKFINKYEDYVFGGYAGVDECDYCNRITSVNEWVTPEGAVHFVCSPCQYQKRFPEIGTVQKKAQS